MAAQSLSLCLGVLLAVVATVHGQCGEAPNTARVINGFDAAECSIPWHVTVHVLQGGNADLTNPPLGLDTARCSGTILDANHVLLTPTCLLTVTSSVDNVITNVVLAAGDTDVTVYPEVSRLGVVQEQFRRPAALFFQPEYPHRTQNELATAATLPARDDTQWTNYQAAIIKVNAPFDLSRECVKSICLPDPSLDTCYYKNCIFAGVGLVTANISASVLNRNKLQRTNLNALPKNACDAMQRAGIIFPSVDSICSQRPGAGVPCLNDFGGALACRNGDTYFLRGFSIPDFCDEGRPSMFQDASKNLNYINSVIAGTVTPVAGAI